MSSPISSPPESPTALVTSNTESSTSNKTSETNNLSQLILLLNEPSNSNKRITLCKDGSYSLTDHNPNFKVLEIQVEDPENEVVSQKKRSSKRKHISSIPVSFFFLLNFFIY